MKFDSSINRSNRLLRRRVQPLDHRMNSIFGQQALGSRAFVLGLRFPPCLVWYAASPFVQEIGIEIASLPTANVEFPASNERGN